MRRPLFFASLCLVAVVALVRWIRPDTGDGAPPDGSRISVIGTVTEKDAESFVIKLQADGNITQAFSPSELSGLTSDNKFYHLFQYTSVTGQTGNNFQTNKMIQRHSKLQCEYGRASFLTLGSTVLVEGDFRAYMEATNPGEFNYAAYYHSLGFAGRLENVKLTGWDRKKPGLREWLWKLKTFWEARLYQIFPEKEASIMAAILLGDKSELDPDVKDLYKRNGIIHILSISGLHITLLGMGLYRRLRRLGVPVWAAALAGSVFLFLYGMLTGFGVSACRAIGMYMIRMLAQLAGRTYDMLTALGVMGAGMACVNPAWLGHMGFQLSYASILGVGALLPVLDRAREEKAGSTYRKYIQSKWRKAFLAIVEKVTNTLRQGFLAGLSILFTTLPIQLWFSYEIPTWSIFLNILILPFMSIVMAAGLIAMVIPGAGIVGTLDVLVLTGYEGLCRLFERLPHPVWNPGRPRIWQVISFYGLWMAVVWGIPAAKHLEKRLKRSWVQTACKKGMCTYIFMGTAFLLLAVPGYHDNRITFLDVGQGDGMCLELASGEVYLFDCGSSSRKRIGERVLIPFLKYNGITKVDAMFLSHGDEDHINGLLELLKRSEEEHIGIRQVILPDINQEKRKEEFGRVTEMISAMENPPEVTTIHAGMAWNMGNASFLCLHPSADGNGTGGNEGSECFFVTFSERRSMVTLLLTGDVEGNGEKELLTELQKYQIEDIDLLKCPHHGSRGTTGMDLLSQLNPTDTIISCGRNNRYGHPHAELLERLAAVDSQIYQTPQTGAVIVQMTGNGYEVVTYRKRWR